MNDAANTSAVADTSGLMDIIEPVAPKLAEGGGWLGMALLIALVLLLSLLIVYLWKYKLPAYRSVKRVREVQRQIHSGELSLHESVLDLALGLRQGLGVKRLRADEVPANFRPQDAAMWADFMQQLESMLYQPGADMNAEKHAALYVKIEKWLWRYGR